jgi:hypothetical protein
MICNFEHGFECNVDLLCIYSHTEESQVFFRVVKMNLNVHILSGDLAITICDLG